VWDAYGYPGAIRDAVAAGCLLTEGLNGQKARIKLMVILGTTRDREEIEQLWQYRYDGRAAGIEGNDAQPTW
jgi:L-asparaginase